jgi:hypothetical protein
MALTDAQKNLRDFIADYDADDGFVISLLTTIQENYSNLLSAETLKKLIEEVDIAWNADEEEEDEDEDDNPEDC